jgi:hypothetical protein
VQPKRKPKQDVIKKEMPAADPQKRNSFLLDLAEAGGDADIPKARHFVLEFATGFIIFFVIIP